MTFVSKTLDVLTVEDERSFRHIALYEQLKEVLVRAKYPFRVLSGKLEGRADRALLLNLTFWGADAGGDVLESDTIPADVVAHAAWHQLATRALPTVSGKPSADALFLGEAIASAFDVYLVGRVLGHAKRSSFLETQVPLMAETAEAAGLPEKAFEALLERMANDPARSFEELRQLLFDATSALFAAESLEQGSLAIARFDAHPFGALLHRYELSNWVLYARAFGSAEPDPRARAIDTTLRQEASSIDWLERTWVQPHAVGN